MKNLGKLMFAMSFGFAAYGTTGTEGHGGDLLRKLFADARVSAANKAQHIKPCSFDQSVPKNVSDWILAHRADYTSDILRAQQIWITDPQVTCAYTQTADASDIMLSFEACRPLIRTEADAAHILFHESVHHFGVSDENFAEAVANAMDTAAINVSCPIDPHDPFNPDACSGAPITPKEFLGFFETGSNAHYIPKTNLIVRRRSCLGSTEDLCTPWSYDKYSEVGLSLYLDHSKGTTQAEAAITAYYSGVTEGIFSNEISGKLDQNMFKGHFTANCLGMTNQENRETQFGFLFRF